jgi:predicted dehydrogenase
MLRAMAKQRIRVGVIGCGLIAQVMHLPHLRELSEEFEIAALCDLSRGTLDAVADAYDVAHRSTRWEDLLGGSVDAVLVLTPGSHAPPALAAAQAGLHVFVEKPRSISVPEGRDMVAAAADAGVQLMVGYMKRYDPAYERLAELLPTLGRVPLVRFTTLEAPLQPYVSHLRLERHDDVPADTITELNEDDRRRTETVVGTDADPLIRAAYREILLDSMIHELNALRGLLGEPDRLEFASIRKEGVSAVLRFGQTQCVALWVDLPGLPRYEQDWSFYAPSARASLTFPSPFLRNAPTMLVLEEGGAGPAGSRRVEELVSYDEAFRRELLEFHGSITEGRPPRTDGTDALRDLALCRSIVEAHRSGVAIEQPTSASDAVRTEP